MLLSKNAILRHLKEGNIFIDPFERSQLVPIEELTGLENFTNLQTASYDVRLGEHFFQQQPPIKEGEVLNPFDPSHIQALWGSSKRAVLVKDYMEEHGTLLNNVKPDDKIIVLAAGQNILAHTEEFIGGRKCISTEMRAKSCMGRINITVCNCAGWGGVGFCNRWTMEMTNSSDRPVLLVVGMRLAQIIFFQVEEVKVSYAKGGGHYQTTDDTKEMIDNWTPMSMLPKFSRDTY